MYVLHFLQEALLESEEEMEQDQERAVPLAQEPPPPMEGAEVPLRLEPAPCQLQVPGPAGNQQCPPPQLALHRQRRVAARVSV